MENIRLRKRSRLDPIEISGDNHFFSPKVNHLKAKHFNSEFEVFSPSKHDFYGSVRQNLNNNLRKIEPRETNNFSIRDRSEVKARERIQLVSLI